MAPTDNPSSYWVNVVSQDRRSISAFLGPAVEKILPVDWECDWRNIWRKTDFDCQAIIQISVKENLWGLMRYGLYPYPSTRPDLKPEFLFLENLEAHPARQPPDRYAFRTGPPSPPNPYVKPVGKWLIWHACQTALEYCDLKSDRLVSLGAKTDAVDYYRDIIGMTLVNTVSGSFGEDSYAFSFNKNQAEAFCARQRSQYGKPQRYFTK